VELGKQKCFSKKSKTMQKCWMKITQVNDFSFEMGDGYANKILILEEKACSPVGMPIA